MKMMHAVRGLGVVAAICFCVSTSAADSKTAEQEVDKAVHEIVAAYGAGEPMLENYFSYYADDISIIRGASGRWDKASYHQYWKDLNAQGGGVATAAIEDLRIQMSPSGDAAVTTYRMPVIRRFPGGVAPPGQDPNPNIAWNMSEVWFKDHGRWTVKSLMYVMAKPPG
jgi:ketosteroid isomerase-like protein